MNIKYAKLSPVRFSSIMYLQQQCKYITPNISPYPFMEVMNFPNNYGTCRVLLDSILLPLE